MNEEETPAAFILLATLEGDEHELPVGEAATIHEAIVTAAAMKHPTDVHIVDLGTNEVLTIEPGALRIWTWLGDYLNWSGAR